MRWHTHTHACTCRVFTVETDGTKNKPAKIFNLVTQKRAPVWCVCTRGGRCRHHSVMILLEPEPHIDPHTHRGASLFLRPNSTDNSSRLQFSFAHVCVNVCVCVVFPSTSVFSLCVQLHLQFSLKTTKFIVFLSTHCGDLSFQLLVASCLLFPLNSRRNNRHKCCHCFHFSVLPCSWCADEKTIKNIYYWRAIMWIKTKGQMLLWKHSWELYSHKGLKRRTAHDSRGWDFLRLLTHNFRAGRSKGQRWPTKTYRSLVSSSGN